VDVDPGEVHPTGGVLDHDEYVEAAEDDGVDGGEVDREDRLGLRRQELSPGRPDRRGSGIDAGALSTFQTIFQTVEAATLWPSPTSSS
jgi:hypothetical protein